MVTTFRSLSLAHAQTIDRVLDGSLIALATFVAARTEGTLRALALGLTAAALWWFASRVVRQYDAANGRGVLGDAALTLVMLVMVIAPLWIATAVFLDPTVVQTFAFVLVPPVLLLRANLVGTRLQGHPVDTVLIVGSGPLARLTGKGIEESDRSLLGYLRFDDEAKPLRLRAPVMGTAVELEEIFKEHVVDEVYLAPTASENSVAVQQAIATCERFGVPFALPVCSYRLTRAKPVGELAADDGYAHFLSVKQKPTQLWLKRLFDICASGFALIVLSPLLAGAALAVKGTRGPILFRQQRVGLHGRTFDMLKFRSMVADAEALKQALMAQNEQAGPVFKIKRDPRITAVGRFIRKFSIDELPQLVNVLRGDMSIVGPRPPLPNEVRKYEAWQRRRLSVRPGLTCVWQVSGRSEISFRDWMLLDMRYIDHWSLLSDFHLILRTFPVVLTGRGAS